MPTLEGDFPSSIFWLLQMASGVPHVHSRAVKLALESRVQTNLDFFMSSSFFSCCRMFGFVAKKKKGGNHCLLFAELDPDQPASAVVNFVTKVMMNK